MIWKIPKLMGIELNLTCTEPSWPKLSCEYSANEKRDRVPRWQVTCQPIHSPELDWWKPNPNLNIHEMFYKSMIWKIPIFPILESQSNLALRLDPKRGVENAPPSSGSIGADNARSIPAWDADRRMRWESRHGPAAPAPSSAGNNQHRRNEYKKMEVSTQPNRKWKMHTCAATL